MERKVENKKMAFKNHANVYENIEMIILSDKVEFDGLEFKWTKNGYNVMK